MFANIINLTEEDVVFSLSEDWKTRARTCKADFEVLLGKKQETLMQIADRDDVDYAFVERESENLSQIRIMVDEIELILDTYKIYPFPPDVVGRVGFFEKEFYRYQATPQILQTLNQEADSQLLFQERSVSLIEKINEMWDNNNSEEEIKNYIYTHLAEIFPTYTSEQLTFSASIMFTTLTAGKNVRINLSEEQIRSLKRETGSTGTCGTCLEEYTEDEEMITICDSKHRFHPDCIVPWLKRSVYCPTCRQDLREIV
tara:strand:+ start:342 stop:1112 length:771 start_codon:yes stop_codon:yes gene_type:complete